MESIQADTGSEQKEKRAEEKDNERNLIILGNKNENEKEASSSSSTSSDDSSDEDFFQLDASELEKPGLESNALLGCEHDDNARVPSEFWLQKSAAVDLSGFEVMFGGSQAPIKRQFSPDATPSSDLRARQSPPLQVMARSDVPDPNRIPASIFASKPATPMEWSVASNESLFSIHVGNSSFSRDHVILLERSGELGNFYSGPLDGSTQPISPLGSSSSSSPVTMDMGHGLTQPSAAEAANAEAMKVVLRAAAEEHADKEDHPQVESALSSTSISRHSDGSTTSFRSFAFPILTGEGRSGSMKVEPEPQKEIKQPYQAPTLETETPKSAFGAVRCKWFTCFSCHRPHCCW